MKELKWMAEKYADGVDFGKHGTDKTMIYLSVWHKDEKVKLVMNRDSACRLLLSMAHLVDGMKEPVLTPRQRRETEEWLSPEGKKLALRMARIAGEACTCNEHEIE